MALFDESLLRGRFEPVKRKAEARHLLALWFGIDYVSMAHPFFEPCQ